MGLTVKNTFIRGKMNKDIDERLIPNGEYVDAQNIRVVNSDGSDIGALENTRGIRKISSLGLDTPKVIGVLSDDSNMKIYFFISARFKDTIIEYNDRDETTVRVLEAVKTGGFSKLGFNNDLVITGVVKIINGDPTKDLLAWTDGVNPPRMINIERAKTFAVDFFNEDTISLIKKPPLFPPKGTLVNDPSLPEGGLDKRFISFAYRYRYEDGEYSSLSPFTPYAFTPKAFDLDFETMENLGMVNQFNSATVEFNVGGELVFNVEVVYKESNSNTVSIIESFNKSDEGWSDDSLQTTIFTADKTYRVLPDKELFRTFDNVPLTAKALELVGTRLVFGNYIEGRDLIDDLGSKVVLDYTPTMLNKSATTVELTLIPDPSIDRKYNLDFVVGGSVVNLLKGSTITTSLEIKDNGPLTASPDIAVTSPYVLLDTYANLAAFEASNEFIPFTTGMTTAIRTALTPPATTINTFFTASIAVVVGDTIDITVTEVSYQLADFSTVVTDLKILSPSSASFVTAEALPSIKSNSNYEVSMIYKDGFSRSSTVLIDGISTVSTVATNSETRNVLTVDINHRPPVWADTYTFAIKSNVQQFQTIYTNVFYEEGLFRWVKLEGANVNKVKEGDTLIVKADLGGITEGLIRTRVLEVTTKEEDFISGGPIIEEPGLYMKIKPSGFDMILTEKSFETFEGASHLRYTVTTETNPIFGTADKPVTAGTRINIFIKFKARGSIAFEEIFDETYVVQDDFASVKLWFDTEVVDLGDFGANFTRDGTGFGFTGSGQQFFVQSHRDGTASRSISTDVKMTFSNTDGIVIFETEPKEVVNNVYFEVPQMFQISALREHQGNIVNQSYGPDVPATVELNYFNCYVQGNGAESYRFRDEFNENFLSNDLRPTALSEDEYKEINRYADLTYSEVYNANSGVNGLNVFNLSTANFKEDMDKKYGSIQKLYSRDTDLIVFQEDKVSKVLFGKDILTTASGDTSVSATKDILGQQIAYTGEYGISRNPESFSFDGANMYFTDAKRGAVMRLGNNGLTEISGHGMKNYFKELFLDSLYNKKLGVFDPFHDQYMLAVNPDIIDPLGDVSTRLHTLTFDEAAKGWTSFFDIHPDWLVSMNNKLFSFKDGDIHIHNDKTVNYNTFYGTSFPSTVTLSVNENPSDIKIHKSIRLEGSDPWKTTIRAFLSNTDDFIESSIAISEYVNREGMWYGYTRRNEDDTSLDSKSVYGLGEVTSIVGNIITYTGGNSSLDIGDRVFDGATNLLVGTITALGVNTITIISPVNVVIGSFIFGRKDARIEGGSVRGYSFNTDLEINSDIKVELFAVNTEFITSNS